jgi:hypothetical protein
MSAIIARTASILNEPGFKYTLCFWGESISGTPEQLQRIGIGIDIHFPERADGRWRGKCIDPRGLEVKLRANYRDDRLFCASIYTPGFVDFNDGVVKPYATGVELCERTYGDVYTGTADALVAAGIVPAGHFPGWPGMRKTRVSILPDGTISSKVGRVAGGKEIKQKSRGQRPTYSCTVGLPNEVEDLRWQGREEWERKMSALPRPAPLIDHPGFRRVEKVKPIPKFHVDGNVIHLAPRSEWMAESCSA